mmetsp:Transcript_13911/g.20533  ORF Transcript_13911/g.20533 Transcript_13911/m.20533 type:complete len:216 (+) Transcript_13911:443-1090(+)
MSILKAVLSVRAFFFLMIFPNVSDPNRLHVMKQENIVPKGVTAPSPKTALMAPAMMGGHCRMNTFIAASNSDWTAPTSINFWSPRIMSNASLIPLLLALPFLVEEVSALFSFQNNIDTVAPASRNTIPNSNGPVIPRTEAASDASLPAMMATRASPVKARPKVSPRYFCKFWRPASPLTQASGAVKRSDRAQPTTILPAKRTKSAFDLIDAIPIE